jgi:type IV pilus assembly protein PilV
MMQPRPPQRGLTLLEVMISMSILLIGLLGMMHLQIWGLSSNQGARAHTQAAQLAREVVTGLDRIPFDDPRLALTGDFGSLLGPGGTVKTGCTTFANLPGVRPDSAIEMDASGPVFQRRWTVRQAAAGSPGARLVAVSVIYRERGLPLPREVIFYVAKSKTSLLATNIAAYN